MTRDSKSLPAKARKLLREATHGLRSEAMAMDNQEIRDQPVVRSNLRLADRIERYLEKQP